VERYDAKAARLYGQAAKQGLANAQYYLGRCYEFGKGVAMDEAKAARLYGQAAEQGHVLARLQLGWCHEHGQGTAQNARAAVEQYRLAVGGGFVAANARLGLCFEEGRGVPSSDPAEAARLYALAAEGGRSGKKPYDEAMALLPDNSLAPGVPSAAALARTRHAVY
jgi:TPR repeat protein